MSNPAAAAPPAELPARLTPLRLLGIASPLAGMYTTILGTRTVLLMAPDIGAALGSDAAQASWLTTAYAVAELLVIPLAVYVALAVSMRTLMCVAAGGFVLTALASTQVESLTSLLCLRVAAGLTGGVFGPLSFMMVLGTFSDRGRHEGLACLAFAVVGPVAGAFVLGGWLIETGDWRLLFWIQALMGAAVLAMAFAGIPAGEHDRDLLRALDWRGYAVYLLGFPALLVVLTQGERLFWLESPLIGLLAPVAAFGLTLFVILEARTARPLIDLSLLVRRLNFGGVMLLNVFFRYGLLAMAFVGAEFLARVQGYTLVELFDVLLWIALPQLVTFPLVYAWAKRVDPRAPLTLGLALFALAAWINASLTADWAAAQFRASLLILALAEPLFMIAMTYEGVHGIQRAEGTSATSLFNLTRTVGEASAFAVLATLITEREKHHWQAITEHLSGVTGETRVRLEALQERFSTLDADSALTASRAMEALADTARTESYVAAHHDAFLVLAALMGVAALISLALPRVPDITAGTGTVPAGGTSP